MSLTTVQLQKDQLNRLFPYHLILNRQMAIEQAGEIIYKSGIESGAIFYQHFQVVLPGNCEIPFSSLLNFAGQTLTFTGHQFTLTGSLEYLDATDQLLFTGNVPVALLTGSTTNNGEKDAYVKTVFEKIGDNVWEHNFSTEITTFSKKQTELLGATMEEMTDNVSLWWNSVSAEDKPMLEENDWKYRNAIIDHHILEYRLELKDGTIKWVLDRGVVIEKLPDGKPLKIVGTHTDITKIKATETALMESERQFRSLSENVPGAVYECLISAAGEIKFTYLSPHVEKLFGIKAERFRSSLEHIYPDDLPLFMEAARRTIENNEPYSFEGRLIAGDGSIKWHSAEASIAPGKYKGERILTGIIIDITARKLAEEALKESELRFRDLTQNVPGVVYQWKRSFNGDSGFTMSPKLKEYFDIDPKEMVSIEEMIHPDDQERWRKSIELIEGKESGLWEFEGRLLYADGSIKWLHGSAVKATKSFDGFFYNCIMLNITAQKETDIKIRKAEQLYKFAVEGAGYGIWEYDFITNEIFYSQVYKNMLGYLETEYSNDPELWIRNLHPDDIDNAVSARNQYYKGIIDRHSLEYRIKCKNGTYIWVLDRGMVVERLGDGRAEKIIGTIEDITKSKQLEIELKSAANFLLNLISNLQEGIIVEDETRHILLVNQKFCDMFRLKEEPRFLNGAASKDTMNICKNSFQHPDIFENIIDEITFRRENTLGIILKLKDNRVYEMDYMPVTIEGGNKGHLWKYADVTERFNADSKLELQKKFYEDILNGIPADVAVLNKDREYLYVNPYAVKNDELRKWLIGKKDEDFCVYRNKPFEIANNRKAYFESVIEKGYQTEWVEKVIGREGKPVYSLRKLYPVLSSNGDVKFMIGYGIDITERKKFEDLLSISEKRYRDLFNFSHAFICTHDLSGTLISINPATCRLLEYEEHEMLGKKIYDFIPADDRPLFAEKYLGVFNNSDHAKGVFCVVSKTGKRNYLLYQNYKVQEPGNEPYIIGFSQDITERKKIEEAIRSGEEKYRSIIENMNLGMVELDPESTIIFANENLCKMSGYEMNELLGQKLYNVFSSGQSRHFIKQKMYLKEKGVSEVYEFVTKNKRGEPRWWLVSGAPLHTHTGEFKGSLLICLDITEQKSFEQELRDAKHQAEQSARAKEVFLANMSHEIRTPMNAILGMGKQLSRTVMDGQQQFYLSAINSAATNLLVIINDILDFSKIEAGKMSLENIGFEMEAIINRALQVIAHKAESKGLLLSSQFDPNIANVLIGDPHRINQVLINLLGNAVKFTEEGSLRIHCSVGENDSTQQLIHIEVVDTGIGMSEEFQKSLFKKFMQEDDKDGKKYSGTGLGMSIVKELVDLMSGTIEVESRKNIGTIIRLNIPFAKGTRADLPKKEERKANSNILFNKRILLVEDNEMNRVVATVLLNQYGAVVDEAVNGEEAINALKHNDYDIILMDMRMPVMDGIEATQIIRKDISISIPIIALTANAVLGEEQKCLEAGMNDFLVKPFEEEDLIHLLAKWIGVSDVFVGNKKEKEKKYPNAPLFNIENLKSISRGNTEFISKMLGIFVKEINLALLEIKTGESTQNIDKIKSTAHRIKPSLGNMSVNSIKNEILQLESFDPTGKDIAQLPELINKVESVLTDVVQQVQDLINNEAYV